MLERGWSFVRRAGTLIVAVAIVVWASLYYPHDPAVESPAIRNTQPAGSRIGRLPSTSGAAANWKANWHDDHQIDRRVTSSRASCARGHVIEPAVRPLGWDWRIGCAAIASFPAREVVVATLGIIYNLGEVDVEDTKASGLTLRCNRPLGRGPTARFLIFRWWMSLMVFSLAPQCAATLVVIKRNR